MFSKKKGRIKSFFDLNPDEQQTILKQIDEFECIPISMRFLKDNYAENIGVDFSRVSDKDLDKMHALTPKQVRLLMMHDRECKPEKYIVKMAGSLDLINQKQGTFTLDYDIDYLDSHIYSIDISRENLGFWGDTFDARICLYDVLKGGDRWLEEEIDCITVEEKIRYGAIEKYPFEFKYNLYDNDCNLQVDDHTFNLVVDLKTEDGKFETHEKTVAIVDGNAIFQNAKGY